MADDPKTAGPSVTINDKRNAPTLGSAVQPAQQQQSDPAAEQMVSVKALKFFPDKDKDGNIEQKGPDSAPFEVPRSRAAELYANGLITFASADDEERHITEQAKNAGQAARDRLEADRKARGASKPAKPLVNPKVEMASTNDAKS